MSIRLSTLANGLRIATDTMNDAESVVCGAWIGVGSRHEPAMANGLAHLTEHMLFKGTRTRSSYMISNEIEKKGGNLNAYTARDRTVYLTHVLPEETERAIDVVADMVQHAAFAPKELMRERQVVLQEIARDIDTPEEHIGDVLQETAFPGQGLGRPILGTSKIVAAIPREKIARYVKTHYHAGNTILVAAGKVDHDEIVDLAKRYWSRLPGGRCATIVKARASGGEARLTKDSEQLHLMMAFPGPGFQANKLHAAILLSIILGGNSSSRLFQKVREKRGLVYDISTMHNAFEETGLFSLYAGTDPRRLRELIPVVCAELRDVTSHITRSELERAKAQMRADLLMSRENVSRRADMLGAQMLRFGRPIPPQKTLAKVEAVTVADTMAMAGALFGKAPALACIGQDSMLESYDTLVDRLRS